MCVHSYIYIERERERLPKIKDADMNDRNLMIRSTHMKDPQLM